MANTVPINFTSPANQRVLAYLRITEPTKATVYTPGEVNLWHLGTHPDLVEYFWGLIKDLHPECACVINKTSAPLLAHPVSGIIFGLAGGTNTLALRLPDSDRTPLLSIPGYGAELKYPNVTLYASRMGDDWVLLKPFQARNAELCRKAFVYAGTLK